MDEPGSQKSISESAASTTITPTASFRVTIAGIKKKFPRVKNVSTSVLSDWMNHGIVSDDETQVTDGDEGGSDCRKLVIFDVRPAEEYVVSHLPSALQLDPDSHDMEHVKSLIQEQIQGTGDASQNKSNTKQKHTRVTAVMYCSVGYRSSAMADRIQRALCNNQSKDLNNSLVELKVYNLEGSIFKWANEHRPLVDSDNQPSEFVHPYSRLWGLLIDKDRWKWSVEGKT